MSPPVSSCSTTPPRAIGEPRPDPEVLNLVDGLRAGIRENGWRSAGAGVSRLVSRGWPIRRNVAAWPVSDWFLPEGERVALDGGKPRAPARARRRLLRTHLEVVEAARAGDRTLLHRLARRFRRVADGCWADERFDVACGPPDRHRCDEPRAVGSGPDHGRQPGRCAPRRHRNWPAPARDGLVQSQRLAPDPRRQELYQCLYADCQAIYPATRHILHRLASIQHSFLELPHTA